MVIIGFFEFVTDVLSACYGHKYADLGGAYTKNAFYSNYKCRFCVPKGGDGQIRFIFLRQRTEMPLIQTSMRWTSAKHNYRGTSIMRENHSVYFENHLPVVMASSRLNSIAQKSKVSENDTA